jgi:hypothetical protein
MENENVKVYGTDKRTLKEYMQEKREVSRFLIAQVFLMGMFAGACLMLIFALFGFIV